MAETILCPHCLSRMEPGKQSCPFCGKSLLNSNPPGVLPFACLLGGRYTIGKHIATDGEGVLYAAIENTGGTRVMVKEYFPVTLSQGRDEAGRILPQEGKEVLFKTTRMDFSDLYQSVMRITPATGLAAVLDVLEENNTVYAVLEQVSGESLAHYLASHTRCFTPAEARSLLQPIMEGIAALHKAGLVHRGVCPANILLTNGGSPRLCGYGTLGLRTEGSELKSQLYEGYSAPEQYSLSEFEGRYTDVYGVAAVFYRLVTGNAPVGAMQRRVSDSLPTAQAVEASVPGYLSEVLARALSLEPSRRLQNVPELMGALASERAAESITNTTKRGWDQRISAKSLFAGSLVVILVLFLLLMWIVLDHRGPATSVPESSPAPTSEPAQPVTVPNLEGLTYSQVQSDSTYSANFRFSIAGYEYSSEYAHGVIIGQTPEANSTAMGPLPLIELTISKGPELVEMPNINGFARDAAAQELTDKHIKASFVMQENNGDYASNCVVYTDVEPGTMIDVNKVTVIVYIAKEREVPPLPTPSPEPTAAPTPTPEPPAA